MHPPGDVRMFTRWTVGLAARGWRVTLIAPARGPVPPMPPGAEYIETPFAGGHVKRLLGAGRILEPLRRVKPDIVLFPDPELIPVMLRYRRGGTPVVFDRHENYDQPQEQFNYSPLSNFVSQAYVKYERYALPKLDGVIVVLDGMLGRINPRTNAIVAYNYPTRETYNRLAAGPTPGTRSYTCVNIGSQQTIRGLMEWLELARVLVKDRKRSEFTILLGGPYDPGNYEQAKAFVAQHQLEAAVDLQPVRFSHADTLNLVSASKIGFSPLLQNDFSRLELQNKLLEYMGAGLPVITSPSSMDGKIVSEAACGYLYWAGQINELADAMERLLDDPAQAQELGRRGKDYAQRQLCWDGELDRATEWMEQLAGKRRRS
jgi:glycosyltransferase involved in cell wall biosynthesis